MMRQPQHGHGHEHGGHEKTQLDRIEAELRIIRHSVGATQGGAEEILRQMATMTEQLETLKGNLDAATTKLGGDIDALIEAFKAAGTVTPGQQAALDALGTVADKLNELDATTVAATAKEPPIEPTP